MDVTRAPAPPRPAPDPDLVHSLVAAFALPRPVRWTDLGGLWTTNLRLDYADGTRLVARAHRASTTSERLLVIQAAKDSARRAGLPVPAAIPTSDGDSLACLPDGTLVEVEAHVDWTTPMKTFPLLRTGFGTLAQLHDALRAMPPRQPVAPPAHATFIEPDAAVDGVRSGAARMRGWGEPILATLADDVQRHCEGVADREARLRHDQVRQLVHGDFWDANVVFLDGQLAGLLDFDFVGERDRIDDLALTLWFFLLEPGNSPPGDQMIRQVRDLVDSYDRCSHLPLTGAERERLPLAIARQPAWLAGSWIPALDDTGAHVQALDLAARLPTAQAVLADLPRWTRALAR